MESLESPDAFDLGFELLPADDEGSTPEEDVAAAERSALEDALEQLDDPADEVPPEPFGRSWEFNFTTGRFQRQGGSPGEVRGLDALKQWCEVAMRTARYAHAVFTDDFGMERPDSSIGLVDVRDEVSDYGERLREALLVHDRITDVVDYRASFDQDEGVLQVENVTVVTDGGEGLSFGPVTLDSFPDAVDDAAF